MSNSRILLETQRFLIIGYKKTKKENFYSLYLDEKEVEELIKTFYYNTGEKEDGFEILKPKQKFSELTAEEKNKFLEKIVPVMLKKPKIEHDLNFDALHCTTAFIENFCKVLSPLVQWAEKERMEISNVLSNIESQDKFFITIFKDEDEDKDVMEYEIGVKNDSFVIYENKRLLTTNDLEVMKNYLKK